MVSLLALGIISIVPVDKAAHFGVSYAINHSCYVLAEEVVKIDKHVALLGCAITTTAIGAARELAGNKDRKDMLANGYGIVLSSTFIVIDW